MAYYLDLFSPETYEAFTKSQAMLANIGAQMGLRIWILKVTVLQFLASGPLSIEAE